MHKEPVITTDFNRGSSTDIWGVSDRSNISYNYRITFDSWYVRNWNLWLDVVIILKTVRVVLKREGAW
ncbi:MAG: sugar transferase [Thermodesulfovibrionales bacterium]